MSTIHRLLGCFCALFLLFPSPASSDYSVTDLVDAAKRGDYHAVHRLITDEHGRRLAKRHDSLSIAALREQSLTPDAVWNLVPAP